MKQDRSSTVFPVFFLTMIGLATIASILDNDTFWTVALVLIAVLGVASFIILGLGRDKQDKARCSLCGREFDKRDLRAVWPYTRFTVS